jgi:hypothetical protein
LYAQEALVDAEKYKADGLLTPALMKYAEVMIQSPSTEVAFQTARITALLSTKQMSNTSKNGSI